MRDRVARERLGGWDAVDPDTAVLVREGVVRADEVLKVLPLEEEVSEDVGADAPEALPARESRLET